VGGGWALVIDEAARFLESRTTLRPRVAVVLGSGLGGFADELMGREELSYSAISHWPVSTAVGHAGKLVLGILNGPNTPGTPGTLEVAVMSGRVHLYEGYTAWQVAFGVRVLAKLGERGSLVLISDHINLQGANPLVGPNDDSLGPRFPDMSEAYARPYRETAKQIAREQGIDLGEGVYAALTGPSYETPAEIRYLRAIGADMVGMSTVPEVIAANHMGARCLGISCVTNMAAGILPRKIHHEEVLETGAAVRGTLVKLLKALLPRLEV
jgi:purine-nucleoside phosphorylase